jgi:protoporphyrinogen oxidase
MNTHFFESETKPTSLNTQPHAVVIGAGFGGLAAAIRLGARGYRVTIVEKLEQPGGRASVFKQDGYTFDAGPTIITAPFVFEELWELCGKKMHDHVALKAMMAIHSRVRVMLISCAKRLLVLTQMMWRVMRNSLKRVRQIIALAFL